MTTEKNRLSAYLNKRTPPLRSAVGYSKVIPKPTGRYNPHAAFDQYAEIMRVIGRDVIGIKDQPQLDSITVSYYADGNYSINLDGLKRDDAEQLRNLMIEHGNMRIKPDHKNHMNIEVTASNEGKCNQSEILIAAFQSVERENGLHNQLWDAILNVEEAQIAQMEQNRKRHGREK